MKVINDTLESSSFGYVLVTPTKDEESTIGTTIASVLDQTIQPVEWVIVSDGSTDHTDSIIRDAQARNPWIVLVQTPARRGRCFGAVARATTMAVDHLKQKKYRYIGLLDSDLRFDPDYFEKVIRHFLGNPKLGVAGGRVIDPGEDRIRVPDNLQEVPGAVQLFRRECFESLRGIHVIPEGGWDMLTCAEARMNGFETALLPDLLVDHLKPRNIAFGSVFTRRWQCGIRDYVLGYHPLFETVKCIRRVNQRPVVLSALSWWLGYVSAALRNRERRIPEELIAQVRREQMSRLRGLIGGRNN